MRHTVVALHVLLKKARIACFAKKAGIACFLLVADDPHTTEKEGHAARKRKGRHGHLLVFVSLI
jgi:hypothetical protein